jgi:predicted hydrocarbon binding protein
MRIPLGKNRSWIAHLQQGIDQLDETLKLAIMRPAGQACASDLLSLCEKYLQKRVSSVEDLVNGWNIIRDERNLTGRWEFEGNVVRGAFGECGCPLVRSGLIELHPVQCYCSQSLMETIFSEAAKKTAEVKIVRTIGRGDDVCEFVITL